MLMQNIQARVDSLSILLLRSKSSLGQSVERLQRDELSQSSNFLESSQVDVLGALILPTKSSRTLSSGLLLQLSQGSLEVILEQIKSVLLRKEVGKSIGKDRKSQSASGSVSSVSTTEELIDIFG